MLQLRPYQRAAADSQCEYWCDERGSPLIVLSAAAGNSLVVSVVCKIAHPGGYACAGPAY